MGRDIEPLVAAPWASSSMGGRRENWVTKPTPAEKESMNAASRSNVHQFFPMSAVEWHLHERQDEPFSDANPAHVRRREEADGRARRVASAEARSDWRLDGGNSGLV